MRHFYLYFLVVGLLACNDTKTASEATNAAAPETPAASLQDSAGKLAELSGQTGGNARREIDSLTGAVADFETRYKKRAELLSENLTEKERLYKELQEARAKHVSPALLHEKERKIRELDDKILTIESRISLMEDTVRLFRLLINAQGKMLMERDEKIEKLEENISDLENKNKALKEENGALKKRIAEFGSPESVPKGANFKFNHKYFSYNQDVFFVEFENRENGKPIVDSDEARNNLDNLQKLLASNADLKVQLIGESTSAVDKATRLQGAHGRVERLREYLVTEKKINPDRIRTRSRATGTNATRVDVQIVK